MIPRSRHSKRSGQAMLFMIMVLLIGTFVVLWNFDLHRAVVLKMKVRDAGDASALASARWQGIALNTIGELNLIQAALITEAINDGGNWLTLYFNHIRPIRNLQGSVMIDGPIVALAAAQQAAFNNGIHSYANYYSWVDGDNEHADFLRAIVDNGIAARMVSSRASDHPLMDPNFYDAISSAYNDNWWCLFYQYREFQGHLEAYTTPEDYWPEKTEDFPDLPSLGVRFWPSGDTNGNYYGSLDELLNLNSDASMYGDLQEVVDELVEDTGLTVDVGLIGDFPWWYPCMYSQEKWNLSWNDYITDHELPFRDAVSEQYDYISGQNIYQLHITYPLLSPGRGGDSTDWVSAAKIFGSLDGGGRVYPPQYFGMVLPAFRDVRLIPVPPNVRAPELESHYNDHLEDYLEDGISALDEDDDSITENGCRYCQLLIYFDDDEFREAGQTWLEDNWEKCQAAGITPGPPSGDEKGPPYGH